jgi:exopolysaccharide production protein ExoZ
MAARARSEVVSIQQLRGIAAMLVVLHHALGRADWLFDPLPPLGFGQGGVDIFFVISGFVMFVAARHERTGAFWRKRVVRIVPLYWVATLVFFAMRAGHYGEPGIDLPSLLKSLFFIPYRVPRDAPPWPLLVPGWTLNIEWFFYLLFGIGLAIGRPARVATAGIAVAVAAGALLRPEGAAGFLYTRPMLTEFATGLGFGAAYAAGRFPARLGLLAPMGLTLLCLSDMAGTLAPAARGLGGVMAVAGALSFEASGRVASHPLLRWLGDASYSIYLVHTIFLQALRLGIRHLPLHGWMQFLPFLFVAIVGSAVAGRLVYLAVERPLVRLAGSRRRTIAAPPLATTTSG